MAHAARPFTLPFAQSGRSSIGIEWELALVDADSGDLRQVATTVLDGVRGPDGAAHPNVTQELLLNTVEVVSNPRATVREAADDLERSIEDIRAVTDPLRVELMCAGTHPFARWDHQKVTDKKRYNELIDRTQWWGRQMLIYGVHVHVGIENRDKVLPIQRAMHTVFAHLQSLSASSPFWGGKDTGYASNRALMFQQLPTAGLGFQFDEWAELEHYVGDMMHTGVIDGFDEVRWDIRPSPRFGTLEMRICDGITNVTELRAMAALTHCLVEHFSTLLDRGKELPSLPAWFLQENKWRSARYGMDAIIILDRAGDEGLVTDAVARLIDELAPVASRLGCADELEDLRITLRRGASYQRQRAVARRNAGELDAVVASLVKEMRAGKPL
ncbi:carboxylate-amine ligase [Sediminihabitans luteus]|uniref:Putative glutamate--cysteine ligase 2 n=1 Tax=Sediminihabitans luteus TaxID=1138585 RepID=A0A2M9CZ42_9CELL|nr:glutamate--cysteine ligase [Sediminihabitans luteus]PJJ77206.1 carboxylate-amine ligase [Sediminihabitans luteus]GII98654.1 putative glutamate--cysteine ligase 2 [Sediminihabitans luteus]